MLEARPGIPGEKEHSQLHKKGSETESVDFSRFGKHRWFTAAYRELFDNGKKTIKPTCDFEEDLFRFGTYEFALNTYIARTNKSLEHCLDYARIAELDEKSATDGLVRDIQSRHYEMLWRQHFNGKVPKGWEDWQFAYATLLKAKEDNVSLSSDLLTATITHPNQYLACTAGRTQRLSTKQLAWLVLRPDISGSKREEIIAAQRQMGCADREIDTALRLSEGAQSRMSDQAVPLPHERKPSFLQ